MVKKQEGDVRPSLIDTFLSLRLQVNLDEEKEIEMNSRKKLTMQEKKLRLSKRERKVSDW